MKKIKAPALMIALLIALGLAGVGAKSLQAAVPTGATGPMSNLVSAIAERFNLNPADVQQVFDAERAKLENTREEQYKTKIDEAVTSGKLTQAQADLITQKHQEIETFKESLRNSDRTEARTDIQNELASLQSWAEQNNIPLEYLHFGFGNHMQGMGKMMGGGMHNDSDEDDQ